MGNTVDKWIGKNCRFATKAPQLPPEAEKQIRGLAASERLDDAIDELDRLDEQENGGKFGAKPVRVKITDISFKSPYDGQPVTVPIILSRDDRTASAGKYDPDTGEVILYSPISLAYSDIVDMLRHEIVHAIDPRLKNKKHVERIMRERHSEDPEAAYWARTTEFDSYSTEVIGRVRDRLAKMGLPERGKTLNRLVAWLRTPPEYLMAFPVQGCDLPLKNWPPQFRQRFKQRLWTALQGMMHQKK